MDRDFIKQVARAIDEMHQKHGGARIESEWVYTHLQEQGVQVPDYAMRDALDFFIGHRCIRPEQAINGDAVRQHGNMGIYDVDTKCLDRWASRY